MSQKYLIITYNHQTFTLNEVPKTYNELVSQIVGHFKTELPPVWSLKYEDSDQDLINLSHSEDYEGLLSEFRVADEFVKVFVIEKEGNSSVAVSASRKETNELEHSMAKSDDSYNVLESEADAKKEGQISDEDVIDVPSLNDSQNIKEIESKKEEDEKIIMEKSLNESNKESVSEVEALKEEKAEKPKEAPLADSYAEIREEKLPEEIIEENKPESVEKIDTVSAPLERPEDEGEAFMMASQHSVISQKDIQDYTKNYEFYAPESAGSIKETERLIENAPLSESTDMVFKKEDMERDNKGNVEEAIHREVEAEKPERNVQGKAVHEGVKCDGCGKDPIVGIRYKCSVCEDFDFCEECEANSKHEHVVFLKIKIPQDAKELGMEERNMNIFEEIDEMLYGLETTVKEKVKKMMNFIKGKFSEETNVKFEDHFQE